MRPRLGLLLIIFALTAPAFAVEPIRVTPMNSVQVLPIEEDAQLHDVQFLSAKLGWAVGEHGVIWHTRDGGESWSLQRSGVSFCLRSVCFLTDRIGWVAGGGTQPFTHQSRGIILQTTDGGATWTIANTEAIPQIHKIKFFGLNEGIAAGDSASNAPTGLMLTSDGGKTWTPTMGVRTRGWRAGDFREIDRGLVAGLLGRVGVVTEGNINENLMSNFGLPGIHSVCFGRGGQAWAVGDGGLVMNTINGGVSWKAPAKPLPEEVRNTFDFRAVAARDNHLWIAGRPGSVIWHSPDAGKSWIRQTTGQTAPIAAMSFSSSTHGAAVGAFGMILTTQDGGRTWRAVRGDNRRTAILSLHTRVEQVSVNLQAQLAGEQGYRSVVSLVPRPDTGPHDGQAVNLLDRLHEATVKAGGSSAEMYWRLPMTVPGLEKNSRRLWNDWMKITEGRLPNILLGQMVGELRMWRPSVVIIDQPAAYDAVGHVLLKAISRAADAAADPTMFSTHRELNNLQAWQVSKVYARLPEGSTGEANIDPNQFLPQLRSSTYLASARAYGRLATDVHRSAKREAYRLIKDYGSEAEKSAINRGEFFGGLHLQPGGPARRQMTPMTDDLELERQIAIRQKQSRAYLDRYMDDPRMSQQIIGQLNDFVNGLTEAEMALQLAELLDVYREKGDWELAEVVASVLVEKFPNEPPAHQAMQWLMQLWISSEVAWRRASAATAEHQRQTLDEQKLMAHVNTPNLSRQRRRFAQLNQQDQQEVLRDVNSVLEMANPDYRRQRGLQIHQKARTTETGKAEYNQGLAQLKAKFEQLNHVADDTPQVQLAGGLQEPDPAGIEQTHATQSREVAYRMAERMKMWQQKAIKMAEYLEQANPDLYAEPRTQFPLAALFRQRGMPGEADRIYRHFRQLTSHDPWSISGGCEIWFAVPRAMPPKPFSICVYSPQRPTLDGVLSDPCWQNAQEIPLTAESDLSERNPQRPFALLAYDEQYLYFAASLPRKPDTPKDKPLNEGRDYDADLSHFDQVRLLLDVDRDHATYYSFTFDQRGWTNDACWEDTTWNPKYFVQAHADDKSWRVEVAIPWRELVPNAPARNDVWNVGVVRTVPAVGLESWTHPVTAKPRPETFGLIKFD